MQQTEGLRPSRELQDDPAALDAVLGPGRGVVVLAPHPDDETLGCGALIAACFEARRPVHVVLVTDGGASHPGSASWPPERLACQRRSEAIEAIRRLGGGEEDLSFLGFPDGAVPAEGPEVAAAARRVRAICEATGAATLLSTGPRDAHADHKATAAIAAATAALRGGIEVLHYPIWPPEPDPRAPARRFSLGRHLELKRLAIGAHVSQLGGLVTDAPEGFVLPAAFVAAFLERDEIFLEPDDAFRHA